MNDRTHDVIVVGAGPVGMMLASELRLAGLDVVVLEKLDKPTGLSKALGITGRGEDFLAMRGLLDRFRRRAPPAPPGVHHFALIPLDVGKTTLDVKGIFVPQAITEDILEERARELGATIRRGVTVASIAQDEEAVSVDVVEAGTTEPLRARYLVGCDGARSFVRHAAGIGFPGLEATSLLRLGDVKLVEGSEVRPPFIPLGDGWLRVVVKEPMPPAFDPAIPMTLDELKASMTRVFRVEPPLREARWLSRFTDASRLADTYRRGRIFLAGDAAHIHLPAGGPGLLTGFGDALNLGWKLAAVVRGSAPAAILDSYDRERRAVGARVLQHTRAQGLLTSPDESPAAMRAVMKELMTIPAVVEHLLGMLWQLDTAYGGDAGDSRSLVGRFAPGGMVTTATNDRKALLEYLHDGRWVAVQTASIFDARVERLGAVVVSASHIEGVDGLSGVLIRPDGHVAWAGVSGSDPALAQVFETWTND